MPPEAERGGALVGDFTYGGKIRQAAGLVKPEQMKVLDGGSDASGITGRERGSAVQHEIRIAGCGAQFIQAAAHGFGECLPLIARHYRRQGYGESAKAGCVTRF